MCTDGDKSPLDAFGVGFIVGGLVDVLGISMPQQVMERTKGAGGRPGGNSAFEQLDGPGPALPPSIFRSEGVMAAAG
jgi:hypothetical protein